jgi:hypothetical protein
VCANVSPSCFTSAVSGSDLEQTHAWDRPVRLTGLPLMTAAGFFSAAMAAWLLGTSRPARVIEFASLAMGFLGYVVGMRLRKRAPTPLVFAGYVAFWALAVIVTICWIAVAAAGGTVGV